MQANSEYVERCLMHGDVLAGFAQKGEAVQLPITDDDWHRQYGGDDPYRIDCGDG